MKPEDNYLLQRAMAHNEVLAFYRRTHAKLDLPLTDEDKDRLSIRITELMNLAFDEGYSHGSGEKRYSQEVINKFLIEIGAEQE